MARRKKKATAHDWPVECECDDKKKPHVHWMRSTGHCSPDVYGHARCRGVYTSKGRTLCCECPCHSGEEPPPRAMRQVPKKVVSDAHQKPKRRRKKKIAAVR